MNRRTDIPTDYTLPSPANVSELHSRLKDSVELRTTATARSTDSAEGHDHFAVLFSGGVDCTLLAFMLDQVLPPKYSIDLLNVAFENPRVIAGAKYENLKNKRNIVTTESPYDGCPDRKTGRSSYAELCRLCPKRNWRFVAINVSYNETLAEKSTVATLMYPHNTEMDLSIALALYFAARGKGECNESGTPRPYSTRAKVLFSGLGADELFGGYTRHTKAFTYSGLEGLFKELDLDFGRLAERNLGRDDRIISYWGREIRYPYLDESLSAWALRLPIWEKCGFGSDTEIKSTSLDPGKLLLRLLAKDVGLINASAEKKRAIQFGARTAKMSTGKSKGTDAIDS